MSLSICCEISTACRLLLKRGSTSTSRRRKVSPDARRKYKNSTVVNRPLAKLRVPANRNAKRAAPPNGPGASFRAAFEPILSTCCRNCCNVLMGARRKLRRSSRRGMPSGSFAAQWPAGPEIAVPRPTIVPNKTRMINSGERPRNFQAFQKALKWLQ